MLVVCSPLLWLPPKWDMLAPTCSGVLWTGKGVGVGEVGRSHEKGALLTWWVVAAAQVDQAGESDNADKSDAWKPRS